MWTCRSCNILTANTLRTAGLGRLTVQYNPDDVLEPDERIVQRARATAGGGRIHSVEQLIGAYRLYAAVLKRKPADRDSRRKFYETEAKLRQFNPAQGASNLRQWLMAVMTVTGQAPQMEVAHAVEMIRATPPARRSQFAQEIWDKRREHHGRRSDAVPF